MPLIACLFVLAAIAAAQPPGVVIDYRPAAGQQYLGSPSLAILPDGTYAASHDFFGPGSTKDVTHVFASRDRGRSWSRIAEIKGQWWSTLFLHRGALYLMGTSRENGFAVIRRSTDGGRTWTEPKDAQSGLLHGDGRYHCAPVPVLIHKGRIWRAMEDAMGPGRWGTHFNAFMMSAPVDADLLRADSWTSSNRLGHNGAWLGGKFGGWLEGNAVATPDGQVVDMLRVDYRTPVEKAAFIRISEDGRTAAFDPDKDFIDFPGGCKKFTVRWDPKSKRYWTLANYVPEWHRGTNPERTRNTVALMSSPDLRQWEVRSIVLYHPDPVKHAFQYLDWLFDGKDLAVVSRTAHEDGKGGAPVGHDANYMTFHRLKNFRKLGMKHSSPAYLQAAREHPGARP